MICVPFVSILLVGIVTASYKALERAAGVAVSIDEVKQQDPRLRSQDSLGL